jgi:hypothetical protein
MMVTVTLPVFHVGVPLVYSIYFRYWDSCGDFRTNINCECY